MADKGCLTDAAVGNEQSVYPVLKIRLESLGLVFAVSKVFTFDGVTIYESVIHGGLRV